VAEDTKTKEPTAEEVKAAMEASATSQEVVLKTESGEVFKGKDWEDVARKAAQAKVDTGTAVRDREGQVRDLQTKISDLQRATEERRETTKASTSPQFNQQKFLTDVETDASEAIGSALAHYLGYDDGATMRTGFKRIDEASESYIENYHIARFTQQCPDYPGGKEASDEMFKRLKEQNLDATAGNLRLTWMEIKDEGKIKPIETSEQETTTTTRVGAPPPLEGTRGAGGGGMNEDEEMMEKFGNMTVEQQEAFMKSPEYAALVERTQKQ
jgi:hypothetical protein